jgi:hypothetical protein
VTWSRVNVSARATVGGNKSARLKARQNENQKNEQDPNDRGIRRLTFSRLRQKSETHHMRSVDRGIVRCAAISEDHIGALFAFVWRRACGEVRKGAGGFGRKAGRLR